MTYQIKIHFLHSWLSKVDEVEDGTIMIEVNGYYCPFCLFHCNNNARFIVILRLIQAFHVHVIEGIKCKIGTLCVLSMRTVSTLYTQK